MVLNCFLCFYDFGEYTYNFLVVVHHRLQLLVICTCLLYVQKRPLSWLILYILFVAALVLF